MSDIQLFQVNGGEVRELEGRSVALEKSLQSLMERHLEALLGVRFLASEYSTGEKHGGRIDTLGLDENGCPVIIEYKRATNENVINQGLFYFDWLMDHKAEFELLVMRKFGNKVAEEIEWSGPRLLCIAGDFTRYDEHAVVQINRNIELIRYRSYPDGFLLLELVNSVVADTPAATAGVAGSGITKGGMTYKTVSDNLSDANESLMDLYNALSDYLLNLGDDVTSKVLKLYVAFRRIKNFACVELRTKNGHLLVHTKVEPTPDLIVEGFTRDVRNIGHYGTGDLEITIRSMADLERAKPLLLRSYEGA